jgi:nitrite reductase/ring-hydroxylating ferredoxin subunit/uncharacterized membrane protein
VPAVTKLLHKAVETIEGATALDPISKPIAEFVHRLIEPRTVRNALSGTAIGHPVHPVLTDIPIGAWTMATALDFSGAAFAPAADLLVGIGLAAALPTAATGWNDWSDTSGREQRVGLVHAGVNIAAVSLFAASLALRLTGHRAAGRRIGLAASTTLLAGGYLGGHLAFARGVSVNNTSFEKRPTKWQPVLADADLGKRTLVKAQVGDASILLCRSGADIWALADRCTHDGAPLHEGKLDGDCVICPWHGSEFKLGDGTVVRGPATSPQPVYETRVHDGQVEVRAIS